MEIERLPLGQSLANKHRAAELKWRGMPPGLPLDMADTIMLGLRSGERTLADCYRDAGGEHYMCSLDRLKKHCDLNPAWAEEAIECLCSLNMQLYFHLYCPKRFQPRCHIVPVVQP
jgi:hypothetical protein